MSTEGVSVASRAPLAATMTSFLTSALLAGSVVAGCKSRAYNSDALSKKGKAAAARQEFPTRDFSPAEAQAQVDAGFPDLETRWFSGGPYAAPNMDGFVRFLLSYRISDAAGYAALRAKILAANFNGRRDVEQALRLAVHDEAAWRAYFKSFSTLGTPDPSLKDSLVPVMLAMPSALRDTLYAELKIAYPEAYENKRNFQVGSAGGVRKGLTAKRSIDAFIRYTFDAETDFAGATSPAEVRAAYERYMKKRKGLFEGTEFCVYEAADVLSVATWVRDAVLRSPSGERFGSPRLTFYGSFPNCAAKMVKLSPKNGNAKPGKDYDYAASDIDVYVEPAGLAEPLRALEPGVAKVFSTATAAAIRGEPNLKIKFETHPYQPVVELDASTLSPLSFRVTKDSLLLYVFPPARFSDLPLDRDMAELDAATRERIPAPRCYALEGICP